MAHFAELNDDSVVTRVVVVANAELQVDGEESEQKGIAFLQSLYGADSTWIQTSYNASFRGNFAGRGFIYDPINDIFFDPRAPYPSWTLNTKSAKWEAPVEKPADGKLYEWNEDALEWVEHIPPISE
jgi:hypothetical protein